MDSLQLLIFIR